MSADIAYKLTGFINKMHRWLILRWLNIFIKWIHFDSAVSNVFGECTSQPWAATGFLFLTMSQTFFAGWYFLSLFLIFFHYGSYPVSAVVTFSWIGESRCFLMMSLQLVDPKLKDGLCGPESQTTTWQHCNEMGIQYQGTKKPVNAGVDYTIVWLDLLLEWSVKKGEYDNMQIFTFEVCQQVCNKVIYKQLQVTIGKRGKENQS